MSGNSLSSEENRGDRRARLEAERDQLVRRVERDNADLEHFRRRVAERDPCAFQSPTAAAEEAEQEARSRLAQKARYDLDEVEQALLRLDQAGQAYGVCERCGGAIAPARLDVLPHARVCEHCANTAR